MWAQVHCKTDEETLQYFGHCIRERICHFSRHKSSHKIKVGRERKKSGSMAEANAISLKECVSHKPFGIFFECTMTAELCVCGGFESSDCHA